MGVGGLSLSLGSFLPSMLSIEKGTDAATSLLLLLYSVGFVTDVMRWFDVGDGDSEDMIG